MGREEEDIEVVHQTAPLLLLLLLVWYRPPRPASSFSLCCCPGWKRASLSSSAISCQCQPMTDGPDEEVVWKKDRALLELLFVLFGFRGGRGTGWEWKAASTEWNGRNGRRQLLLLLLGLVGGGSSGEAEEQIGRMANCALLTGLMDGWMEGLLSSSGSNGRGKTE